MQLKTILNHVQRHKSFIYDCDRLAQEGEETVMEISIRPRANSRPICSGCGKKRPGYDTLPERRFEFVPLWGMAVFFLYAPRRVQCAPCGIKVERVPWAEGKSRLTTTYQWFLARWAKRLSWQQTAKAFRTSWENVYRSVCMAVTWGLSRRSLDGIQAIGVDEIGWRKGHHYLTLVYQIEDGCKRLLYVGRDRTVRSLLGFFRMLGPDRASRQQRASRLRFVCSDMWQPYLKVIAKKAPEAIHVLDRFHIMAKMNKAIDEVRAAEAKRLKAEGYEQILKHSRWCLLKRPENLTDKQTVKLQELQKYNLQSLRARLQREDFQRFWEYQSPFWAAQFLVDWCKRVMRSRIEPMKKVARMLDRHGPLILNWFLAKGTMSSGVVEGLNYNAKLSMKNAYGFRTEESLTIALFHRLGALPELKSAHEFC
jgi:transposase